jgi:hypothetical protein
MSSEAILSTLVEEVRALRGEVAELRGVAASRRAPKEGFTATEAAEFLGCDRKTFYRRHAPRLSRNAVTNLYPRAAIEAERRAILK